MNLRIIANYPATDGSMPESVEVDLNDLEVNTGGAQVLTAVLLSVIDRLLAAPRVRTMTQQEFDEQLARGAGLTS